MKINKLKRLFLTVMFILGCSGYAHSIMWVPCTQVTIGWMAVSTYVSGLPIPPEMEIVYKCFKVQEGLNKEAGLVALGTTDKTEYTHTFHNAGFYVMGVAAYIMREGVLIGSSTIAWSDNPDHALDGKVFLVVFMEPLEVPLGLHVTPAI